MLPSFTCYSKYSALLLLLLSTTNVSSAPTINHNTLPPECIAQTEGYFIPPNQVSGAYATNYCRSMGGRLADVTNKNIIEMVALVNRCIGGNRNVRIQTWDTNDFGTSNLALNTGTQAGAGSVSITGANEALFALCQIAPQDTPFPVYDAGVYSETSTDNVQAANHQPNKVQIPDEIESAGSEVVVDEKGMPMDV